MDALLESVNVRDLLAGHDVSDASAPLSAPDLRLLINRLESHSLRIKSRVQSYLLSHHSDFSSLFALCNDAVARTGSISDEISDVVKSISDRPIDVEIRGTVDEIREKLKEARVKRELVELVEAIVEIREGLKDAKECLSTGRLRIAAERLRDTKVALRIGDEEAGEPIVYGLLRKEWSDCFEEFQVVAAKLMENAVRFEHEPKSLRVKYRLNAGKNDEIHLNVVLGAMEVIGVLDYGLAKVADLIVKDVISLIVTRASTITLLDNLRQSSDEISEANLKLEQFSDSEDQNLDGDAIYSGILRVVNFVYRGICFENATWIRSFGRLTWPRISDLIISSFLSKVVPEDASKLADFQKVIKRTSEFETALEELNFIVQFDEKGRRLSNYAENVEIHFASRKKMEILAKARHLLLKCDFAVPQELTVRKDGTYVKSSDHVVDLLFSSETCVVSKGATHLMQLVHKTLQDVCVSTPKVALEFYHAARESIVLYEAVVPVKMEKQLNNFNQAAVLMHNDCLYLFEEILGLAFEYRANFPSSIQEYAVFADIAPRFKVMAEEILQRQIRVVVSNLGEAIDGADGFQNTHQMQQFESAKFSIEQVVFILEKVRLVWEPLLIPKTYKRSMCMVLDSVFRRITRDILLLDDMAADETFQLQKLIYLMLETLSSLMESLIPPKDSSHRLEDLIPSLSKIRKLAELLDMPLKSITSALESGELFNCGFTKTEVQDFIKAIFTDSPLRKECLWRIENVNM